MDYVPNDIRPVNINLEVVSLNIKLSISIIHNEYDCANKNLNGVCITISIETNTFGISTSPLPIARRQLFVTLLRSRYLRAATSNHLLFVKTSIDYIITKLLESMYVNFSQSEYSVRTSFNFYV